ncbi:MAG: MOSC domain-containing protein [Burkholderiaceae bacterium]
MEKAPYIIAVNASSKHWVSKPMQFEIRLLEGLGIEGDAHCGAKVKHRYLAKKDPTQPNLRQIHLVQSELFDELAGRGFTVVPGQMGENVTTRRLDLLALATGTELALGADAVIRLTGLRNPCVLLDRLQPGLMSAVLDRDSQGQLVRKAGVMAVVVRGGVVQPGDAIEVVLPEPPHRPLRPV